MIGHGFHLVIVCLLVTSSHQTEFDQLIRSVSNNCGNLLQAYRANVSGCQGFRSIQSKLSQPFCTSGDINKLEEVLCGTGSSLPGSGTNTGGVTSAGVPVHHSSPASAVVKETPDVTSPTDTTADVGPALPVNETDLQKTFRELGDEITSPMCKAVLNNRANVLTSFSEACCMLISFQTTLVPGLCTQLEYDRAHDVLCVNVTRQGNEPTDHVTDSSDNLTTDKCAKTTSTDVTGTTTSTDVTDNTTSKDFAGTTTSIDTTSKTTLTTTPVATTPTSTTSPDPASSTTAPPRANIFPLKLRLLFSVVTHDDVKEQLEVLVN
ncbi:uncharacterized protein LOC131944937 [Physella acuta]|uniref:uncharacterized protein LOC131944937 n=1 Tax=Physella acuta TaxID=109671 RepID=UPI0027DB3A78|nr:uncharacterized protein LOC131944937 [Physella acuta]